MNWHDTAKVLIVMSSSFCVLVIGFRFAAYECVYQNFRMFDT